MRRRCLATRGLRLGLRRHADVVLASEPVAAARRRSATRSLARMPMMWWLVSMNLLVGLPDGRHHAPTRSPSGHSSITGGSTRSPRHTGTAQRGLRGTRRRLNAVSAAHGVPVSPQQHAAPLDSTCRCTTRREGRMLDAQSIRVWSADKAGAGLRDPSWSARAERLQTPAARFRGSSTPLIQMSKPQPVVIRR
jgi:hypothetical protein